ncbi:CinA family protein [Microbacterium cremeum]|uniref:CinA family protein n=1 Tax=Microbacterium cremeum TaxID=2782169 RepID=UPI001889BA52|nr:nicotinamide-nucleotide amidohydrolase family protein [Microbacterium cremeum]
MTGDAGERHPSAPSASAEDVLAALARRGWSVGTAESLTAGLVVATLVDVPGASASVRGGIAAYATDVKTTVLGVDRGLLARAGPVDAEVARQMARGARRVLDADVAIATTGVAGPDPQDGQPVGAVYIAITTPEQETVERLALSGTRREIRVATVAAALGLCASVLRSG